MAERYIDANALKAEIRKQPWKPETKVVLAVDWICGLIDDAPTADVEPIVRAEWVAVRQYATKTKYMCSVCGRTILGNVESPEIKFPYCHCGAHMEGET